MIKTITVLTVTAILALTACGGGGDSGGFGSGLPEPPADDASLEEIETFMDEYTAWLEDCGDLNRCAELVENDPRYNKWLTESEIDEPVSDESFQDPEASADIDEWNRQVDTWNECLEASPTGAGCVEPDESLLEEP
jgi:hypothetical protein